MPVRSSNQRPSTRCLTGRCTHTRKDCCEADREPPAAAADSCTLSRGASLPSTRCPAAVGSRIAAPTSFPAVVKNTRPSSRPANMASAVSIPTQTEAADALLQAQGLTKRYPVGSDLFGRPRAWLSAVEGVDL